MKAVTAEDWPKMTRTPSTRMTRTRGAIHHTLRRQKNDRSPPAMPTREKRLRKNRRMAFMGDLDGSLGVYLARIAGDSLAARYDSRKTGGSPKANPAPPFRLVPAKCTIRWARPAAPGRTTPRLLPRGRARPGSRAPGTAVHRVATR